MNQALEEARQQGGKVHGGGRVREGVPPRGVYVRPAIVEIGAEAPVVQRETFAPILYFIRYRSFEEAVTIHNSVPQGLASAIFTRDVCEAELFCSAAGSDAWKAYMRRATNTVNYSGELPLAQGIKFET
jgi:aldehyde dehydrogenase (NAD+)